MTNQPPPRGNGTTGLAFILGALVVVVGMVVWYMMGDPAPRNEPDISIQVPGGPRIEGQIEPAPEAPAGGDEAPAPAGQ